MEREGRENVVNVNRHVNGVTATVTVNVNGNVKFTACSNSAALEEGRGQGQGLWHGNCNNFMHIAAISIAIRSHKNKTPTNQIELNRIAAYRIAGQTHTHTYAGTHTDAG